MNLRAVLGESFGVHRTIPVVPPPPDMPPRLDPAVKILGKDDDAWTVTLGVDPYSLESHNLLVEVRAYLIPQGHGVPGSAADYLASSYPFASLDTKAMLGGVNVVLPLPDVAEGDHFGQLVLLLQDDAQPQAPPPSPDEPPTPAGPDEASPADESHPADPADAATGEPAAPTPPNEG